MRCCCHPVWTFRPCPYCCGTGGTWVPVVSVPYRPPWPLWQPVIRPSGTLFRGDPIADARAARAV